MQKYMKINVVLVHHVNWKYWVLILVLVFSIHFKWKKVLKYWVFNRIFEKYWYWVFNTLTKYWLIPCLYNTTVLFFLHYLKALLCCWYCCEIVSSNPVVVYFPLYASLLVWYNIVELPIKSANNLQTQAYDDDPTNNVYGILKPYDLRFDVIYPKWVVLIKDQTCGGAWAIIRQWAPIKPKGTLIDHILWSSPSTSSLWFIPNWSFRTSVQKQDTTS